MQTSTLTNENNVKNNQINTLKFNLFSEKAGRASIRQERMSYTRCKYKQNIHVLIK